MKRVLIILLLISSVGTSAQVLDRKAFYFRGQYAMERIFSDSTNLFSDSIPKNSKGIVEVKTEILPDGSIGRTSILNSVNDKYDKEAVRLIKLLPGWRAAKFNNELVASFVNIKIDFRQYENPNKIDIPQFQVVDKMPQFPGGDVALRKFISKNVRYPTMSVEMGEEGRVFVQFVVTKEGKIIKERIVRGVSPLLDEEALRVVQKMKRFKWEPGTQNGKKVNTMFNLPISFKLQ